MPHSAVWFVSHGGHMVDAGMAYGFCEEPVRRRLYAVVPESGSGPDGYLKGHISELDAESLSVLVRHYPFNRNFRGRLVAPLCLTDTVQIGMAETQIGQTVERENVMELRIDEPSNVRQSVFGGGAGQSLFWDRDRDAVFYGSEWSNIIVRLDRRTGEVSRGVGGDFLPRDQNHWFFFGNRFPGSLCLSIQAYGGRRSFYAGHWLTGSTVYEIGLDDFALRSVLEPRCGAVGGINVDEEFGRVLISSMWGLDVFDAASGRPLRRIRTGFGARTPVIDPEAGLIYAATTIEGRIHVFDRETLDRLGVIPIGYGPRNSFVTSRKSALLAASVSASYYWRSTDLRERFALDRRQPVDSR